MKFPCLNDRQWRWINRIGPKKQLILFCFFLDICANFVRFPCHKVWFIQNGFLYFPKCCRVKPTDVCYGSRKITLHYITSFSLQNRCRISRRRHSLIMWSIGCWNLFLNVSQKKETIANERLELVKLTSAWLPHCSVSIAQAPFRNYQAVRKPEALTAWLAANFPFCRAIYSTVGINRNVAVKIQSCL